MMLTVEYFAVRLSSTPILIPITCMILKDFINSFIKEILSIPSINYHFKGTLFYLLAGMFRLAVVIIVFTLTCGISDNYSSFT